MVMETVTTSSKTPAIEEVTQPFQEDSDLNLDIETVSRRSQVPQSPGLKQLRCLYQDCSKSFNRQARLTEHLRSHTNERPFQCHEHGCNKAFLRDSHLKHHIKSAHTDERNYSCSREGCQKRFATGTRLRRHETSHETKDKYTCNGFEGCNETFRKHATLSRHIMAVHEKRKPFGCTETGDGAQQQCTMRFDTAEKLRSHCRATHDQSRFICTACKDKQGYIGEHQSQASFATYALLQRHIAELHPPTCPQCSLPCTSDKDLFRHLELVHDLLDPQAHARSSFNFSCTHPNCDRVFSKKGNLSVHVKTVHEGRRDYICGETELRLTRPEDDQCWYDAIGSKHPREAEEEQAIAGCGRHFTCKATLEEHVRTVHLGLDSRRQQRNKRRRAEKAAHAMIIAKGTNPPEDEEEEDRSECRPKRIRKPRKPMDRRRPKSSIAHLTGSLNAAIGSEFEPAPPQSSSSNPFDSHFIYQHQPPPPQKHQQQQEPDLSFQDFYAALNHQNTQNSSLSPPPAASSSRSTSPHLHLQPRHQRDQGVYDYSSHLAPHHSHFTKRPETETGAVTDTDQPLPAFASSTLNSLVASGLVDPILLSSR